MTKQQMLHEMDKSGWSHETDEKLHMKKSKMIMMKCWMNFQVNPFGSQIQETPMPRMKTVSN